MTRLMTCLDDMGVRCRAKGGKRWWPARATPWLGIVVDTNVGEAKTGERRVLKALNLREDVFGLPPGPAISERELVSSASFLNFLQWVTPGGFCDLRSGR